MKQASLQLSIGNMSTTIRLAHQSSSTAKCLPYSIIYSPLPASLPLSPHMSSSARPPSPSFITTPLSVGFLCSYHSHFPLLFCHIFAFFLSSSLSPLHYPLFPFGFVIIFFPFLAPFFCIPFSSFLRFVFLVFLLSNSHHYIFSLVSYVYTFLSLLCIIPSPSHRILFLSFFSAPSLCNVLKSLSLFFLNLTQFFHFFVPSTSSPLPLYLSVFISIFSPLYSSFHLPLPPHISLSSSFSLFPSPFSIFSPLSSSPLFSLLHFPSLSFREYLPASTHLRCH